MSYSNEVEEVIKITPNNRIIPVDMSLIYERTIRVAIGGYAVGIQAWPSGIIWDGTGVLPKDAIIMTLMHDDVNQIEKRLINKVATHMCALEIRGDILICKVATGGEITGFHSDPVFNRSDIIQRIMESYPALRRGRKIKLNNKGEEF